MSARRAKSCYLCRLAKSRCSLETPCLRCSKKGLDCHYAPLGSRKGVEGFREIRPASYTSGIDHKLPQYHKDVFLAQIEHIHSGAGSGPESNICTLRPEASESYVNNQGELYNAHYDDGRSKLPTGGGTQALSSSCLPSSWPVVAIGPRPGGQNVRRTRALVSENSSDSAPFSTLDPSKVSFRNVPNAPQLMERGRSFQQGSPTAKMILQRLAGYTNDMESGKLPPFIHQSCLVNNDQAYATLPAILFQCARNIGESLESARPDVWERISGHLLQLCVECESFDEQTLLQALQAATLYAILCSQLSKSFPPESSGFCVTCIERLGKQLFGAVQWTLETVFACREQWVLVESIRRMACILYLIDLLLLVDTETPSRGNCDTFWDMPLPCHQALWRATSHEKWRELYERTRGGSLTLGRLLLLRQSRRLDEVVAKAGGSATAEELVEW